MMSFPYKATSPNPLHTAPPAGETSVQIPGTAGLSHSDPQWESTCLHSVCRVQFSAKKREHEERKEDRREQEKRRRRGNGREGGDTKAGKEKGGKRKDQPAWFLKAPLSFSQVLYLSIQLKTDRYFQLGDQYIHKHDDFCFPSSFVIMESLNDQLPQKSLCYHTQLPFVITHRTLTGMVLFCQKTGHG